VRDYREDKYIPKVKLYQKNQHFEADISWESALKGKYIGATALLASMNCKDF